MKDELIKSIADVLCEWNPLGEKAESISDLEGYKYEAMDILSAVKITKEPVEKVMSDVLTQAFGITLNDNKLKHNSLQIEQLINVQ
jgi:hypothetical protein